MLPHSWPLGYFSRTTVRALMSFVVSKFDSLSQLYADLRNEANRGWRVIERSTHVILALARLHIVPGGDLLNAIVQIRCLGRKDAGDTVAAKAKGQDWSNLFGE
jgi:hypothetical protein